MNGSSLISLPISQTGAFWISVIWAIALAVWIAWRYGTSLRRRLVFLQEIPRPLLIGLFAITLGLTVWLTWLEESSRGHLAVLLGCVTTLVRFAAGLYLARGVPKLTSWMPFQRLGLVPWFPAGWLILFSLAVLLPPSFLLLLLALSGVASTVSRHVTASEIDRVTLMAWALVMSFVLPAPPTWEVVIGHIGLGAGVAWWAWRVTLANPARSPEAPVAAG